jgi:ABC-type branched-subunit amino acid transport system ATPase component
MLRVQNLKKYFGGIKAVDGCSFEIAKGKITGLIGPNGSGKSTIFNLVSGILRPDEGEIILEGENITNKSPEKIFSSGISRLFQQSRLFGNLTVWENLLLAVDKEDTKFWKNLFGLNKLTDEEKTRIKEMLAAVEMENFEDKLADDLSYGQKRLIELSRTILHPHNFSMLDEPVAGVNPRLRNKIAKILQEARSRGETILLIEHDIQFTFEVADYIIVINHGKVIAQGRPEEIKNNPQVLGVYFGE